MKSACKCIKISTNKPMLGLVVPEIVCSNFHEHFVFRTSWGIGTCYIYTYSLNNGTAIVTTHGHLSFVWKPNDRPIFPLIILSRTQFNYLPGITTISLHFAYLISVTAHIIRLPVSEPNRHEVNN